MYIKNVHYINEILMFCGGQINHFHFNLLYLKVFKNNEPVRKCRNQQYPL